MGAWSHEPFGNDDACDWASGLEDIKDLSYIESTLDRVLENKDYLEAPESSEAIAAIEVLAKLLGKGTQTDSHTSMVDAWVNSASAKPSSNIINKANRVLDRILGTNSELLELWQEGGADDWVQSIDKLRNAINT